MATYAPFARPLYVMVKPAGSLCNLHCTYCYYLEKRKIYGQEAKEILSDELLERYIKQYIEAQTQPEVVFSWHGGETLMRPISFYRKALELEQRYGRGCHIQNTIQTNGTLLTPEWCRFFRDNHFLVGVSIDGPREVHDRYRRIASGKPSFDKVMHGIEMLTQYGVEWNALAVVNDQNVEHPLEFYNFFKQIGCHFIQFAPIVERIVRRADGLSLASGDETGGQLTPYSITAEQWGDFLCVLFDEWIKADVGTYFIQLFDATLSGWAGVLPGVCTLAEQCGHAGVMEWNGDVYSCDHFVYPEYRLGNIRGEETLTSLMYSPKQQAFARKKAGELPRQCRECDYLFACHGECPKNRFITDCYGEPHLNYLCKGYHKYFEHVAPYMDFMLQELKAHRPPANVMEWARHRK